MHCSTAFEQTLHSARYSCVSVLVRAHCVLLTHMKCMKCMKCMTCVKCMKCMNAMNV